MRFWRLGIGLALMALVMGLAGWRGYRAEQEALRVPAAAAAAASDRGTGDRARSGAPPGATTREKERGSGSALARLERLRQESGGREMNGRQQLECWQQIRGFSEAEIRGALAGSPDLILTEMLFHRWAQLDGAAAAAAAAQPPYERQPRVLGAALNEWAGRDLQGLLRWAEGQSGDLIGGAVNDAAARQFLAETPQVAVARARAEYPAALVDVFALLATEMSATAETRLEFLKLAATQEDARQQLRTIEQIAVNACRRDPQGAIGLIDEAEGQGISAEQSRLLRDTVIRNLSYDDARAAMNWAIQEESKAPPAVRAYLYSRWFEEDPGSAAAWAEDAGQWELVAAGIKRDAGKFISQQLAGEENSTWSQAMRAQFAAWQQHEPAAAAEWLRSLPEELHPAYLPSDEEVH